MREVNPVCRQDRGHVHEAERVAVVCVRSSEGLRRRQGQPEGKCHTTMFTLLALTSWFQDCAGAILYSSDRAVEVAMDAMQCLGGNGYINGASLSKRP